MKLTASVLIVLLMGAPIATRQGFFSGGIGLRMLASAQSKDRNRPTPITSKEVSGVSRKGDGREFYYSFTAGPGDLIATLDVEGLSGRVDGESLVRVTLYDQDSREVGKFDRQSGLNGERNHRVETFHFTKETPLVVRLTFGGGASKYWFRLGGNVVGEQAVKSPATSTEILRLPKAGVLTIKMRDGSVRTVDLADVEDARIATESPRRQ